jgi:hypothetical protein
MTLPGDDGMTERQRACYAVYNEAVRRLHAFELRNRDEYEQLKGAAAAALREFNLAIVSAE